MSTQLSRFMRVPDPSAAEKRGMKRSAKRQAYLDAMRHEMRAVFDQVMPVPRPSVPPMWPSMTGRFEALMAELRYEQES